MSLKEKRQVVEFQETWGLQYGLEVTERKPETKLFTSTVCLLLECIKNLHLIALPHFDRHTVDNQVKMLKKLLGAVYPR